MSECTATHGEISDITCAHVLLSVCFSHAAVIETPCAFTGFELSYISIYFAHADNFLMSLMHTTLHCRPLFLSPPLAVGFTQPPPGVCLSDLICNKHWAYQRGFSINKWSVNSGDVTGGCCQFNWMPVKLLHWEKWMPTETMGYELCVCCFLFINVVNKRFWFVVSVFSCTRKQNLCLHLLMAMQVKWCHILLGWGRILQFITAFRGIQKDIAQSSKIGVCCLTGITG